MIFYVSIPLASLLKSSHSASVEILWIWCIDQRMMVSTFFIVFETLKLVSAAIFDSYGIRLLHVHNIHYVVHLYVVQLGAGGSANMAWCTSFLLCLYLCVCLCCVCVCVRAQQRMGTLTMANGRETRCTIVSQRWRLPICMWCYSLTGTPFYMCATRIAWMPRPVEPNEWEQTGLVDLVAITIASFDTFKMVIPELYTITYTIAIATSNKMFKGLTNMCRIFSER